VKRIEINLAGTFGEVLGALLRLQRLEAKAKEICSPRDAESGARGDGNCDAEVKQALRSLYEAANGRQVKTETGFIAIAPPVAGFLRDEPFYVATQDEFFVEAFARILIAASPPHEAPTNGARAGRSKAFGSCLGLNTLESPQEKQMERCSPSRRRHRAQPTVGRHDSLGD
jgi:hypothetical protein